MMAPPARLQLLAGKSGCPRCHGFVYNEGDQRHPSLVCLNCGARDLMPDRPDPNTRTQPKPKKYAW